MRLPAWDQTASEPEQAELLAALIRCAKPEVIVEAGSYKGHSSIYMARACRENDHGHVYTCDVMDYKVDDLIRQNHLERYATWRREQFHQMLKRRPYVDFAYIDDQVGSRLPHMQLVLTKLRAGGIVCVDDTATEDGWEDVHRIREFCDLTFMFLRGLSIYYKTP